MTAISRKALWTQYSRSLVVAVAFLLALTTARNSGVWAHLASGRGLLASNDVKAVHPSSWLADAGIYLVYSAAGGAGLVLAKALAVSAAIALMLVGPWRTSIAALLAAIALGGWLQLTPTCLSYLFLAFTVMTLGKPADEARSWSSVIRRYWPLSCAFVIWGNVDPWCVLGVAFVGLSALSWTIVQAAGGVGQAGRAWRLFILTAVSACVSPLPWLALTRFGAIADQLAASGLAASPFRMAAWSSILEGRLEGAIPILAFWVLTATTAASFLPALKADRRETRAEAWARVSPWLVLFVAAAFYSKIVPFLIIVSGASAALNLRVLAASPATSAADSSVRPRTRIERLQFALRVSLGLVGALVLLAVTWAGYLQGRPFERRNWTVEADPSLVQAAEAVERWYADGQLQPEQETVFLFPDAQDLFGWCAPRSRTATRGVDQVRSAVLAQDVAARVGASNPLSDPRVGCVVVCDQNRAAFVAALQYFTRAADLWKMAHLRGRVAVFVRTSSALPAVDLWARTFSISAADRAASTDGSEFATASHWYDPFIEARPSRSLDRDESITYLLLEEATRSQRLQSAARRFLAELTASLVGNPWPSGGAASPRTLVLGQALLAATPAGGSPFPFDRFAAFQLLANTTPDYYLAVRAARRGVTASPRDAAAFESLGQAYLHLLADPVESSWGRQFPPLRRLRLVQAAAAFRQALALDPNLPAAHLGLGTVYLESQFLDLALASFEAYERLSRHERGSPGEGVGALEKAVADARRKTEANAANLTVLDHARLALRNGLAGEALDLLLHSDVAVFGNQGLAQEFDLLLAVGRVNEVREWLAPEHRGALGLLAYNWCDVQARAAVGDYAGASQVLNAQLASIPTKREILSSSELMKSLGFTAREVLNRRQNAPRMAVGLLTSMASQFAASCTQVQFEWQSRTEALLLLAVLALEEGDIAACQANLESIRRLWENVAGDDQPPIPHQNIVRQMASMMRR